MGQYGQFDHESKRGTALTVSYGGPGNFVIIPEVRSPAGCRSFWETPSMWLLRGIVWVLAAACQLAMLPVGSCMRTWLTGASRAQGSGLQHASCIVCAHIHHHVVTDSLTLDSPRRQINTVECKPAVLE